MSLPLESLDYETFAPLTGDVFTLTVGETSLELRLGEVKKLGHRHPGATRDPFSLSFIGPRGLRVNQGIGQLTHATLGKVEMFLTQVGDGANGSELEAIFT